jgi:phage shock protein C
MKRLYKSTKDQIITGVIGGVGEYFDIDPTVLRLAYVVLVLLTGIFPGIIAYIIAFIIIPDRPRVAYDEPVTEKKEPETPVKPAPEVKPEATPEIVETTIETEPEEVPETMTHIKDIIEESKIADVPMIVEEPKIEEKKEII